MHLAGTAILATMTQGLGLGFSVALLIKGENSSPALPCTS